MALPGTVSPDSAQVGLDFIVGFSIFILGFIFASFILSGLLLHLQSRTIDFDAVAYRTGVILVEDPGQRAGEADQPSEEEILSDWHVLDLSYPYNRDRVLRLGLALERDTPAILNKKKGERFFTYGDSHSCQGKNVFCYPDDYRAKLIFGDYPYNFNISLKYLDTDKVQTIGPPPPDNYGYIRRVVKIKEPGSIDINASPENPSVKRSPSITVNINIPKLYEMPVLYRIDPLAEDLWINISNIGGPVTLKNVETYCKYGMYEKTIINQLGLPIYFYPDGASSPISPLLNVNENLSVLIEPEYFGEVNFDPPVDATAMINITFQFVENVTDKPLHIIKSEDVKNPPRLVPAVLEVRIW